LGTPARRRRGLGLRRAARVRATNATRVRLRERQVAEGTASCERAAPWRVLAAPWARRRAEGPCLGRPRQRASGGPACPHGRGRRLHAWGATVATPRTWKARCARRPAVLPPCGRGRGGALS